MTKMIEKHRARNLPADDSLALMTRHWLRLSLMSALGILICLVVCVFVFSFKVELPTLERFKIDYEAKACVCICVCVWVGFF